MVRPQNIDHMIGALQFLVVISDVAGVVGRPAVGSHDHPVFIVAALRRARPQRTVLLIGDAELHEPRDAALDGARVVQTLLALPKVENDPEAFGDRLLLAQVRIAAGLCEVRQPVGFGRGAPALAVRRAQVVRDRHQIRARVAVRGKRKVRLPQLPVARVERTSQRVELRA
jgi:hypothetical protein